MSARLELIPLERFPEVVPGADLAALIAASLEANALTLQDGDVLVLAQKIVSKA
ncbi:MAG: coenzyme F420-0:L-glutamate ligase, partial [Haliea sp.]